RGGKSFFRAGPGKFNVASPHHPDDSQEALQRASPTTPPQSTVYSIAPKELGRTLSQNSPLPPTMVAAILLLSALSLVSASPSIPRGVSPGRAGLYKPQADGKFTCLTAPTVSIPIEAVNDNYCDCP